MDDAAARFYRRNYEEQLRRRKAVHHTPVDKGHRYFATLEWIRAKRPHNVLELGYGYADVTIQLAQLVDGTYHIADIVDMTDQFDLPKNIRLHVLNLDNDFPFVDGEFDFIVAMMVIEHLFDPFHSFSEIARCLARGGAAAINLPNVASLKCRLRLLRGKMPVTSSSDWFEKRQWDGNHLHYFTIADVKRLAGLYGLRLVGIAPVGRSLALKKLAPSLLCHEITYLFEKA